MIPSHETASLNQLHELLYFLRKINQNLGMIFTINPLTIKISNSISWASENMENRLEPFELAVETQLDTQKKINQVCT